MAAALRDGPGEGPPDLGGGSPELPVPPVPVLKSMRLSFRTP
jgi:hypothetical protein